MGTSENGTPLATQQVELFQRKIDLLLRSSLKWQGDKFVSFHMSADPIHKFGKLTLTLTLTAAGFPARSWILVRSDSPFCISSLVFQDGGKRSWCVEFFQFSRFCTTKAAHLNNLVCTDNNYNLDRGEFEFEPHKFSSKCLNRVKSL